MFSYHEIQSLSNKPVTELCEIMFRNYSDKSSLHVHHNYSLFYDTIFSSMRNKELNILEIGIGSVNPRIPSNMTGGDLGRVYVPGASIRGWYEYFPHANIYCCDIDSDILHFEEKRINGFFMDQTNLNTVDTALNGILKDIEFDIIIDYGLHYFPVNCEVMHKLLPKVKKGGYYIIEDIIHSQFNYSNIDMEKLNGYSYQYLRIPNSSNNVDNNLFVVKC